MQNVIETTVGKLAPQASGALAGIKELGTTLSLSLVTEAAMTTAISQLETENNNVVNGKAVLTERQAGLRGTVAETRAFCFAARDVLKQYLGKQYSAVWDQAGFVGSLQVPETAEKLSTLLLSLKNYFTAHPTHENAPLNVSASRANTLYDDIVDGRDNVNSQKGNVTTLVATRDQKAAVVRTHLRNLIRELSAKLTPLDGRWRKFGFNLPGAVSTPDAPENVTVVLIGPSAASVKWDSAARADHYRVWKKVTGVDGEFVAVGSPADLDFTLEGLPGNSTIEIAVSAVNTGGESQKSAVVTITTL